MVIRLLIAWLCNLIDTSATLHLSANFAGTELNPISAVLLQSPPLFAVVKLAVMTIAVAFLWPPNWPDSHGCICVGSGEQQDIYTVSWRRPRLLYLTEYKAPPFGVVLSRLYFEGGNAMLYLASRAARLAEAELGYLEKKSNAQLDSKTANAGKNNYTKYARDLATAGFFNDNKQGYPWCAVFFVWLIWMLCGKNKEKALSITFQVGPYGAGCNAAAQYYKQAGRFHATDPRLGDQIFFWNAKRTSAAHTGMVVDIDDEYVYTIEGNTSGAAGVVANGGGVFNKRYALNDPRIYGYGSPNYDKEPETTTAPISKEGFYVVMQTLKPGSKHPHVKVMQMLLIGNGYSCGKYGADGDFGTGTKKALGEYQDDHKDPEGRPLTVDYICGPATWASLLKQ